MKQIYLCMLVALIMTSCKKQNANTLQDAGISTYNIIILDRSGSMSPIQHETVAGTDSIINDIKAQCSGSSQQMITLMSFSSEGNIFHSLHCSADSMPSFTENDYTPDGMTPLYDAIGETCKKAEAYVDSMNFDIVSVSIITDGLENDSRTYSEDSIRSMIARLNEKGWLFAYVGAGHDVESVAKSLGIKNYMTFAKSSAGTMDMIDKNRNSRFNYYQKMSRSLNEERRNKGRELTNEEKAALRKRHNAGYY